MALQQPVEASVTQWGNGLAVRLNKAVANAAGVKNGTPVRISVRRGRIIVEATDKEPTLAAMLAAFDAKKHGGEAMAFGPIGKEAW